jgi:hypothetical protein
MIFCNPSRSNRVYRPINASNAAAIGFRQIRIWRGGRRAEATRPRASISCNRDFSLIEGYNTEVELTRTQTLMQGASQCDFRYVRRRNVPEKPEPNPGHAARR